MNWTEELFDAVLDADLARVKDSISNGADILAVLNERDILSAALAWSANVKQEVIDLLLGSGADPNLQGHDGTTALYWAASCDKTELVKTLIGAGATVNAEDPEDGHTSLHAASENGNLDNVNLLLRAGGESALDRFDYIKRTPLMCAIEKGNIEIVRTLIEAGSDVNAHDESRIGDTALILASQMGRFDMVKLLVEAGADAEVRGWMGLTALSAAKAWPGPDGERIVELLKRVGGSVHQEGET